jgi:hypothetical protein
VIFKFCLLALIANTQRQPKTLTRSYKLRSAKDLPVIFKFCLLTEGRTLATNKKNSGLCSFRKKS